MSHTHQPSHSATRHAGAVLAVAAALANAAVIANPPSDPAPPARRQQTTADSLQDALDRLAEHAGIQIVYSPELVVGLKAARLHGHGSTADALRQLLAESGLVSHQVNPTTFLIQRRSPAAGTPIPVLAKSPQAASTRTLETLMVSGSLIGSAQLQTATPTFRITADAIEARGFNSLADVLRNSVFASGATQGPQHADGITQGAQTVNLFGLGPELTLILLDGKPLASFGRLYNGSSTVYNLTNIPLSIIDHIDVMPGGGSSIYGSQAVAGVINIVTRESVSDTALSMRAGAFQEGGGQSHQSSFVYGRQVGAFGVMASFGVEKASPIWGYQRRMTAGTHANPDGRATPYPQTAILNYGPANAYAGGGAIALVDPPEGCATMLFGGTTTLVSDAGNGNYCGSRRLPSYLTLANQLHGYNGLLKLRYTASTRLRVYADVMLNQQQQQWFPSLRMWQSHGFVDADTGQLQTVRKVFAPEEMPGGISRQMHRQHDLLYQATIGANGHVGASGWEWDLYHLRSGDDTRQNWSGPTSPRIGHFFDTLFGPSLGTEASIGVRVFRPDYPALFRPMTPAQYAGTLEGTTQHHRSWLHTTRATFTQLRLGELPGGPIGAAFLLEGGAEGWYANDPLLATANLEPPNTRQPAIGGRRSRWASAFELNLPALRPLTLALSGRYDHAALQRSVSNQRFTFKAGAEYRPANNLLLRGNYATVLKLPELPSIYLAPAHYIHAVNDRYACAIASSPDCSAYFNQTARTTVLANPALQPTTANTWSMGVVWSPTPQWSLSTDYLRIRLRDEIAPQDIDLLMQHEAQCRLGQRDPASASCVALTDPVNGQVQRAGPGGAGPVTNVTTYYANLSSQFAESIGASGRFRFVLPQMGEFTLQLDYNTLLRRRQRLAPDTPEINLLTDPLSSFDFRSISSGSLTWNAPRRRWSSTLYAHRHGSTPNLAAIVYGAEHPQAARLRPWLTFNWSLRYQPTPAFDLSLAINNVANAMPPRDPTFTSYPYFNFDSYNVYGREFQLRATVSF